MKIGPHAYELLREVRGRSPLVHNITNFVAMASSANVLLAAGASPVMAHCREEAGEMASLADALVLNIGTLQGDWVESMLCAARAANRKGIPVVLDPAGAGATVARTSAARMIMGAAEVSVLRGNASEISSLASGGGATRGVESTVPISAALSAAAGALALGNGCVVAVSGESDLLTDGRRTFRVANGTPLMGRVTGMGCGLSAVIAAFCAVSDGETLFASTAASAYYGICGEIAAGSCRGPGSFFPAFLDALHAVGREEIEALVRVREEEPAQGV